MLVAHGYRRSLIYGSLALILMGCVPSSPSIFEHTKLLEQANKSLHFPSYP